MKLYFSHSIRGKAGPNASHDQQAKNCADAIGVANNLRALFRKLVLYVPADVYVMDQFHLLTLEFMNLMQVPKC